MSKDLVPEETGLDCFSEATFGDSGTASLESPSVASFSATNVGITSSLAAFEI